MLKKIDPFKAIALNTIAALTHRPDLRAEWLSKVQELQLQAQIQNDPQMVTLLDAVAEVLGDESLDAINPTLRGDYELCWERIIQGLKSRSKSGPVTEAVLAFSNAYTWDKLKQIVEAQHKLLLTEDAERIIVELLDHYKDDPNTVLALEERRELLVRCRKMGIDTAFELQVLLKKLQQIPANLSNTSHRIQLCQAAIELIDQSEEPDLWAVLQVELANHHLNNPLGNRAKNIEQAIQQLQESLQVITREGLPELWAGIMHNLAVAYRNRINGNRAHNIEKAIQFCTQSLQIRTRKDFPLQWGETKNTLGAAYAERISEKRADNIEQAINHFQQALEVYSQEGSPEQWAMIQNSLGAAYAQRIRGRRADNIERAIGHFQQALQVRTRETFPEQWAETQTSLGSIYTQRIRGQRVDNIERAISHFHQALQVRTRETFPEQWAKTQSSLGAAYIERIRGERAENVERAISHFHQALQVGTRETFPEQWAILQNNLAAAYIERIRGERADNIERAIYHFWQVLQFHTREAFPEQWARLQSNLATAYLQRINGDWAENTEQVIHHSKQALEVYTFEAFPEKWAKTQNKLAQAYSRRIREELSTNIELAIEHYEQTLHIYTREALPEEWAQTHNNLAVAYLNRIHGDHADNIDLSIHHSKQALEVYTLEAFPEKWAKTQNSLAYAYAQRIRGGRAENVKQAIHIFEQSLQIQTIEHYPIDNLRTLRHLGNLYFDERMWEKAIEAYNGAIEAGESLLAAAYTEAGRRSEIGETSRLYARAAYCLLQMRQPGEALTLFESGKTRLLADVLALGDDFLEILPDRNRQALIKTRKAVCELEAEMHLPKDTPARRDDLTLANLLCEARYALKLLIDEIRAEFPKFMTTGLDLHSILELIPPKTALVVPLVTSQGSAVFIIPHGVKTVTEKYIIPLDGYTKSSLLELLRGPSEYKALGGWIGAYFDFRNSQGKQAAVEEWQVHIEKATRQLWIDLFAPTHRKLVQLGIKRIILMPSGGLQLLPLHAAWREIDGAKRYIIDDYEIIYAPSVYVLDICRQRAALRGGHAALVAGIDEYEDLPRLFNACAEAETIAKTFNVEPLLNDNATKDVIKNRMPGKAFIHLSCHGEYNWGGDPLSSALFLTGDEPLTLSEIIRELNLDSARLVTLSACETGIIDIRNSPDEYIGLPAGILQAGASAVVSSLWAVDDRSTALLMDHFYNKQFDKGMPFAHALTEAQLWLRDVTRRELGEYYQSNLRMSVEEAIEAFADITEGGTPDDKPYAHPFYWAPFTFTGY